MNRPMQISELIMVSLQNWQILYFYSESLECKTYYIN